MSYDQNFYQQPDQDPSPREPKSNAKWFVIGALILVVLGCLIYGAMQLGKRFGNGISNLTKGPIHYADSVSEQVESDEYASLLADINSNPRINDSTRTAMAENLTRVHERAIAARELIRKYGNGFLDTMEGQSGLSRLNKSWAHNYFIRTGRATEIKNVLLVLRDESFRELPYSQKDSTLLKKIPVYESGKDAPEYLRNLTSWEAIHYDQPAVTVGMNIKTQLLEVRNYENKFLHIYRNYLNMQDEAAQVHP